MEHSNHQKDHEKSRTEIKRSGDTCTNCNGRGTEIVDMGGPDVEVVCGQCKGTCVQAS